MHLPKGGLRRIAGNTAFGGRTTSDVGLLVGKAMATTAIDVASLGIVPHGDAHPMPRLRFMASIRLD